MVRKYVRKNYSRATLEEGKRRVLQDKASMFSVSNELNIPYRTLRNHTRTLPSKDDKQQAPQTCLDSSSKNQVSSHRDAEVQTSHSTTVSSDAMPPSDGDSQEDVKSPTMSRLAKRKRCDVFSNFDPRRVKHSGWMEVLLREMNDIRGDVQHIKFGALPDGDYKVASFRRLGPEGSTKWRTIKVLARSSKCTYAFTLPHKYGALLDDEKLERLARDPRKLKMSHESGCLTWFCSQ
jgi:hypothetical protein